MKFSNLFKKEISGLLTKQVIFSMIATMVLFIFLGQVVGGSINGITESVSGGKANVANLDATDNFTGSVLAQIGAAGYGDFNNIVLPSDITPAEYPEVLAEHDITSLVIIPNGFGKSVLVDHEPMDLILVSEMKVGSILTNMNSLSSSSAIDAINKGARDIELLSSYKVPTSEIQRINSGVPTVSYTTLDGKVAKADASMLSAMVMMQMVIAPFVVLLLLMMASQMIMTAISTEKIDKTLETLLSTPVSRLSVLLSKMTAAVVAALLNALTMGIGMVFYIGGFAGGLVGTVTSQMSESGAAEQIDNQLAGFDVTGGVNAVMSIPQAMATLGLTLSVSEYLLFGLQIILSLAIGLAASLILGAMATDTKSLGSLMMPVVMITMLPFFITMFVNVNEMTFVFKAIMYIIPFTHSYMAVPNLISGNNLLFWCGIIYQLLFLAGTLYAAIRMFMSDKLFTVNFGDTSNQTKRKSLFGMKK